MPPPEWRLLEQLYSEGPVQLLEQPPLRGWHRARKQLLLLQGHRRRPRPAPLLGTVRPHVLGSDDRGRDAGDRGIVSAARGDSVMSRLQGKVCLVTGSSGGLGRAFCRKLAAEGAVVAAPGRSLERLGPLMAELDSMRAAGAAPGGAGGAGGAASGD